MSAFQTWLLIGVVAYALVLVMAFAVEWRRVREQKRIEREQWQRHQDAKARLLSDARKRRQDLNTLRELNREQTNRSDRWRSRA